MWGCLCEGGGQQDVIMYMIAVYNFLTSGTTHTHSTEWDGKWKWKWGVGGHTYAICWTVMCHLVSTWSCGRLEGQVPDLVPRLEGLVQRFVGWLSTIHWRNWHTYISEGTSNLKPSLRVWNQDRRVLFSRRSESWLHEYWHNGRVWCGYLCTVWTLTAIHGNKCKWVFKCTNLRWDWISISLLSWCSTLAFWSCDLNSTFVYAMSGVCAQA